MTAQEPLDGKKLDNKPNTQQTRTDARQCFSSITYVSDLGRFAMRLPHRLARMAWRMITLYVLHRLAERRAVLTAALQSGTGAVSIKTTPPVFDPEWYLVAYPDVVELRIDPFKHYETRGKDEGRHPTSKAAEVALGFDPAWYLATYPDIAASGQDPFRHWLDHGRHEGRHTNSNSSFTPGQLAVLAKSYHTKSTNIETSADKGTPIPLRAGKASTFDSSLYWRARYRTGGNSGSGSYGRLAEFKAEILNAFIREHNIASVIEFGCGDGAQLALADYPIYVGYDVADESIALCRSKFAQDPTKTFRSSSTWDHDHAELTLSLDVIFHLIEDDVFHTYMCRLFSSAERYVIIYSSNHEGSHPAPHVKHRHFSDWVEVYHADFKLVRRIPNRWPLTDDDNSQSFSDFYIYKRIVTRKHALPGHLVVSLTSYSARFPTLELTLRRILQQTIQPDETVLWLTEEDKAVLPDGVLALQRFGLTIRITKDMRSYKKIIPTLQYYPDSFIITLDDDFAYPLDTIEPLIVSHRSPTEILCRRAHKITYDTKGEPRPYNEWQFEVADEFDENLFATGGAGTLYPPHALPPEVMHEAAFTTLAPLADDVWLFFMERLAGRTIRRVGPSYPQQLWPGCDEQGLWRNHNQDGGNDQAITALTARYGSAFISPEIPGPLPNVESLLERIGFLEQQIADLRRASMMEGARYRNAVSAPHSLDRLRAIESSRGYRLLVRYYALAEAPVIGPVIHLLRRLAHVILDLAWPKRTTTS